MKFPSWLHTFTRGTPAATFGSAVAEDQKINIKGAEYSAVDTKDGYFTLKDVLLFAEVPKGEKGAPEDVKSPRMQEMVSKALSKYEREKFAAPAHRGHHKALAFEDPEFLGFGLPKRVGRTTLDGKEQDAVYGDLKVKASGFERVKKGELPFISPEVNWESWEFSSFAFLDSMPPHFRGPLITVGKITEDPGAKFTVGSSISMGKFTSVDIDKKEEATDEKKNKENAAHVKKDEVLDTKNNGHSPEKADVEDGGHDDAKMCAHCVAKMSRMEASYSALDKTLGDIHFRMGLPYKSAQMGSAAVGKQDSTAPVEDEKAKPKEDAMKFADDPEARAKFDAQEARTKALEDKLAAKDAEETKKARITAAFEDMSGYPMTDSAKASVAYFAGLGDEPLKKYVESLKAQTPKNPPRTVSEFESTGKEVKVAIAGNDPDIAAFQAKGPEAMEGALKYAARFEAMKQDKSCKGSKLIQEGRKVYIETMMELDPSGNFGRKAS